MNGLNLRISRDRLPVTSQSPVALTQQDLHQFGNKASKYEKFLFLSTADQQVLALKEIFNTGIALEDDVKFAAVVFLLAEFKHPVKCYLTRHISKTKSIQELFKNYLTEEILKRVNDEASATSRMTCTVASILSCTENFPSGAASVKNCEYQVFEYMKNALKHNLDVLQSFISPTEKNDTFTLIHNIVRVILGIVQRLTDYEPVHSAFSEVYQCIERVFNEKDAPMDSKSLCGILKVTLLRLEHGSDYWVTLLRSLKATPTDTAESAVSKVCMYSAIITVVPVEHLQSVLADAHAAQVDAHTAQVDAHTAQVDVQSALDLTVAEVLEISEKFSVEPLVALIVARTLLNAGKSLRSRPHGVNACLRILSFVWAHVEHFMDSVRHLTSQILAGVLQYFGGQRDKGFPEIFDIFFAELIALPLNKKAFYVGVSASASVLGTEAILIRIPDLVQNLLDMLSNQALQANVSATIEALLHTHTREASTERVYNIWIEPFLKRVHTSATDSTVDSIVLNILENIVAKAVRWDPKIMDFITPEAERLCSATSISAGDLKCGLVCRNLARRIGSDRIFCDVRIVRIAIVHSNEEIRILALSLLIETSKTTETFTRHEFELILEFLRYNINTQSPHLRHLILSLMKKLMKRLECSYRVLYKQDEKYREAPSIVNANDVFFYYVEFLNDLRCQCFDNLMRGANYSRRTIALQIIVWCEELSLEGYVSVWKEQFVEILLEHLEDSYENNKQLAVEALTKCPRDLVAKKFNLSLNMDNILNQGSSIKPPDCLSAAYKLLLLQKMDPTRGCELLSQVWERLERQVLEAEKSTVMAAHAPVYGLVLCAKYVFANLDASKIPEGFIPFVRGMLATCKRITDTAAPVVNSDSPEGHLPMDAGRMPLPGDRTVTAQMVLLCAWRAVKEVSLLLGEIASSLDIGEHSGTLTYEDVLAIGEHFTSLLAETKHRGAFEQAYVGFTRLCSRLWKCVCPRANVLPRTWLRELMTAIAADDTGTKLCATRRSAGVPFMIQALVATELQVSGNPSCFHDCMVTLLRLADFTNEASSVETRTHSLNILRALYRHTALGEVVNGYVGSGLVTAIRGFEGTTWAERNSSTLLFSALMVRIFGVQRSKDSDKLCIRNKMTGRTFFLRYPDLYDFMLEKLRESARCPDVLRPALYPVLLLLSRLYPYSLEETSTNLKLVAFVEHVRACGGSCVLKTRQLAAKALVPLVSHDKYISYVNELLECLCDRNIKRNFCHGLLLQLLRLLDNRPANLNLQDSAIKVMSDSLANTLWILQEVVHSTPCYITADEYVKVINMLLWRFPEAIGADFTLKVGIILKKLFSAEVISRETNAHFYGRDVFLSNAISLHILLLLKNSMLRISSVLESQLKNQSYEVILSVLNFISLLKTDSEDSCDIRQNIRETVTKEKKEELFTFINKSIDIRNTLYKLVKHNYMECRQKAIEILSMMSETQKGLLGLVEDSPESTELKETDGKEPTETPENNDKGLSDDSHFIVKELIKKIEDEPENISHLYLASLREYIATKVSSCNGDLWLDVIRMLYASCSSDSSVHKRREVIKFLDDIDLLVMFMNRYNCLKQSKVIYGETPHPMFELQTTFWATLFTLLQDEDETLRQKTSDLILKMYNDPYWVCGRRLQGNPIDCRVIPNRAIDLLFDLIGRNFINHREVMSVCLVLALLDFDTDVCISDEISDECRVFDQSEKHNTHIEDIYLTMLCVNRYNAKVLATETEEVEIRSIIFSESWMPVFQRLCGNNYVVLADALRTSHDTVQRLTNLRAKYCLENCRSSAIYECLN